MQHPGATPRSVAGAALLAVAKWSLLRFDNSPGTWHVTTLGQAQPLPRVEVEGYQQMPQPSRGASVAQLHGDIPGVNAQALFGDLPQTQPLRAEASDDPTTVDPPQRLRSLRGGERGRITLGMLLIGALALLCALIAACYTASQHTGQLRQIEHQALLRCKADRTLCRWAFACGNAALTASEAWRDSAAVRAAAADAEAAGESVDISPIAAHDLAAQKLEDTARQICAAPPPIPMAVSMDGGVRAKPCPTKITPLMVEFTGFTDPEIAACLRQMSARAAAADGGVR